MIADDEDLVRQAAGGDRTAFLTLYDRYSPRVFGAIMKVLSDRADAEDVLQETMLEAWRKAGRYDPALGSVATWLVVIGRSRALDASRRRSRPGGASGSAGRGVGGDQRSPYDAAARSQGATDDRGRGERDDDGVRIRAALGALPVEQQAAIRMAFYQGMTREQIASALGVPVGTVKTRIRLGVRHLAEVAREQGGTERGPRREGLAP